MPLNRLSELKKVFSRKGFVPRKKLGQNFCIDPNMLKAIPRRAGVTSDDLVLEIGSGTGLLTHFLARDAKFVLSVEIDSRLAAIAREYNRDADNVEFIEADILEKKSVLSRVVLGRLDELRQEYGPHFKMVSNLPYCIATPVIMNILDLPDRPVSMTFLIQKELADKLVARHGRKDFSAMSVCMQVFYEPQILKVFPPAVFWPRPKVESALVRLDAKEKPIPVSDYLFFRQMVKRMFQQKRKTLKNVLSGGTVSKDLVGLIPDALKETGIDPMARAEAVPLRKIIGLCNFFHSAQKKSEKKHNLT